MRVIFSLLVWMLLLVACRPTETTPRQTSMERPTAPAGDDFRADAVKWVAATDKPQLIEIFSYD
jgi:hypothetical protein